MPDCRTRRRHIRPALSRMACCDEPSPLPYLSSVFVSNHWRRWRSYLLVQRSVDAVNNRHASRGRSPFSPALLYACLPASRSSAASPPNSRAKPSYPVVYSSPRQTYRRLPPARRRRGFRNKAVDGVLNFTGAW